ncbi:hypothetical protein LTR53_003405 [Teratosphaeriaceae sp. CCFEE 6253]|nr:hypothetical protein LTR53_003405 [Teratosphaeriaceae sp. CCFEE 6253]
MARSQKTSMYQKPEMHQVIAHRTAQLRRDLNEYGIRVAEGLDMFELARLWMRVQRGQLVYSQCTVKELAVFIRQKGLSDRLVWSDKRREMRKPALMAEYIEVLEMAEPEMKFEKFMDLPAELRKGVWKAFYEHTSASRLSGSEGDDSE